MDPELSKQQQMEDKSVEDDDEGKKPSEKKKRIKKEKITAQGSQANGGRNSKKNQPSNTYNQIVALKRNQQNTMTNEDFIKQLGSIQIPEQLRLFFMKELRQTVPVVKELLPQHKFLLFGEIPLDLDFFINKMKIRKLDSNGNVFDKFRSIQRNIRFKNRIEFDLDSQYQGLSDFQYIIEALRSMNNNVAFQFAQSLQDYQNSVRYILARNDYYKKYLTQKNEEVDINKRIQQSLECAQDILDTLDPDNEIFIYNIISKQFNGLVTLKKGFSKGLIKNLGVSDDEFIRAVQENKVFHSLVDQVNHASIIYSQTKMEENPYLRLRPLEIIKSIHPDIHHHHSHQFQNILRTLVKEAIKKQDVIEQFLQKPSDEMIEDELPNYIPNPLPTFQQYQKFIKNINLHPHRYRFPPHKQIELFQNITQVLTKKQQNKIDFQHNLQKITEGNSGTLSDSSNIGINKQFSSNSEMQQEYSSATISDNSLNSHNFNMPQIFDSRKQQIDERSIPIFNEASLRNISGCIENQSQPQSLNQSQFVDPFENGYGDDNLSISSKSNLFPLLRSISQNQQLSNVSQGMITNLFNEFNTYQNSLKRSVVGDDEEQYRFDDENSSSLFYDKSYFRPYEDNQSIQRQQSHNLLQSQVGNESIQVENNLAQSVFLGNPNQQQNQEQKRQNNINKQGSSEDDESFSQSKNLSQSYSFSNQNHNSSSSPEFHQHKHYHHSRHKKFRREDSNQGEQNGENTQKENKIKDFYEQLLQYIGNDEEEDGLFPFPHINSTFKEDIIREYEQIRSMLEDGKYMSASEFNQFIEDIKKQPRIKKKQYLKHLMKIPDQVDYEMKEKRKREEKEKRKKAEKMKSTSNSTILQNNLSQSQSLSPSHSISPRSQSNDQLKNSSNQSFQYPSPQQSQKPDQQQQPLLTPAFNNIGIQQQKSNGGMFNFSSQKENNNNAETQNQNIPRHHYPCFPPPPHHHFDKDCEECKNQQQNQKPNSDDLRQNHHLHPSHSHSPPPPHHHHHHLSPPPLHHVLFPFKPHHLNHPPPHLPNPQQLIELIREYFQTESITDQSDLLIRIKNTLQEAVVQGSINKKMGDFLSLDNNIDKASEVINHIITDKDAFINLNDGRPFPHHHRHHHHHHPHHHHPFSHNNPHRRQDQVIKKIYELNKNLSLDDEIQINDYLEVFYIGKSKMWKNFSKDFILNNSFRDVEDEMNNLKKNELLQKYYQTQSSQIQNDLQLKQDEFFQKRSSNQFSHSSQSSSPTSKVFSDKSNSQMVEGTTQEKVNKELLQKIINQFKMGPPHPFKILLLLKKALQKIVKHIPSQYLTQPFLKNSLKMIVFHIQGDIENFIQCRQRIPLEIIESMEKKVMKQFCKIPII